MRRDRQGDGKGTPVLRSLDAQGVDAKRGQPRRCNGPAVAPVPPKRCAGPRKAPSAHTGCDRPMWRAASQSTMEHVTRITTKEQHMFDLLMIGTREAVAVSRK